MRIDGQWWYDLTTQVGLYEDPLQNEDALSAAFWLLTGSEFKITRSDDSSHTALLKTTGGCLGSQSFRSKITSYGNFRNSVVWSSDRCLGSCSATLGGQYASTAGFRYASHSCSASIGGNSRISFWCDWSAGDGSVMMIGKGGTYCGRADHGIGATEDNAAKFSGSYYRYDFSDNPFSVPVKKYALNLWVR